MKSVPIGPDWVRANVRFFLQSSRYELSVLSNNASLWPEVALAFGEPNLNQRLVRELHSIEAAVYPVLCKQLLVGSLLHHGPFL